MIPIVKNNLESIATICKNYKVAQLFIFGSASHGNFIEKKSDIDFAVRFEEDIPTLDLADYYFGLIEGLEDLLGHKVDLVTLKSLKNKIFIEELERTMVPLYAA